MNNKKVMLINAAHEEESRVAIVENGYLQELDIESAFKELTKSNIYKGRITKVEASLQAAFVEYGAARQGFLPLTEIHPDYWKEGADKSADPRKVDIKEVLEPKQEILVQVVKEERGTKGAALTTFISLAGRYLVLSPNTNRGGISRKLSDEERKALKAILTQLEVPSEMGLIVRTAGKDQTLEALQRDYQYLRRLWDEIRIKSETTSAPALIYLEGDLATRAIRDHFSEDIQEIWVDNHEVYTRTKQFVHAVLPGKEKLVKLYRGKKPLFRQYGIEGQCEELHEREIRLPSGGSIVFDPTEALTAIDVNSSRATKGKNIDDTALATNLEAAREIARQLRIRDIGGLIVIDFIDMATRKHGQQVEETLREACKQDKARIQISRISRFGLLEMSRQRLHPSMRESTTQVCPRCSGRGFIRTVESMALQMLTRMEDWAEAGKKPNLVVQVPSDTGEYLMNHKRNIIARIEEVYDVQITLQIRPDLVIPHYRIERQWTDNNQQRTEVLEDTMKAKRQPRPGRKLKPVEPVVGIPTPPPESEKEEKKKGLGLRNPLKAIIDILIGDRKRRKEEEEAKKRAEEEAARKRRNRKRGGRNRRRGGRGKAAQGGQNAAASGDQGARTGGESNGESKKTSRGGASRNRQRQQRAQGESRRDEAAQAPSAADQAAQDPAATPQANQGADGEKRSGQRRRRRRRRRSGTGQGQQEGAQATQGANSGQEAARSSGGDAPSQPAPAQTPAAEAAGGE